MNTGPELRHRHSRPSYLRVHSLRATSCRNTFVPSRATRPNDTSPAWAHNVNDWVNNAFNAAPCRARNRLIATKSGAACAVRNRNAMSSWQRRSNAREEVTPWE